jgi:hypothetical protein
MSSSFAEKMRIPQMLIRNSRIMASLLILFWIPLHAGCQAPRSHVSTQKSGLLRIRELVVVGFRPAVSAGDGTGVIRSPLSGATFMGGGVTRDVVQEMTTSLLKKLVEDKHYKLISPGQARGVYSSIVSSDEVLDETEVLQKVGKAFSSDAVLVGYIYRWIDRKGTDYAINQPASVAFELCFLRPGDGAILWKGRFDKTQRSLSENILDMDTFVQGKGKWMTANSLADLGLVALVAEMPKEENGEEQ